MKKIKFIHSDIAKLCISLQRLFKELQKRSFSTNRDYTLIDIQFYANAMNFNKELLQITKK